MAAAELVAASCVGVSSGEFPDERAAFGAVVAPTAPGCYTSPLSHPSRAAPRPRSTGVLHMIRRAVLAVSELALWVLLLVMLFGCQSERVDEATDAKPVE